MTVSPPPVNNAILSVSGLNRMVRQCLESTFPLTWVGGEISNLTYAASGHVYFSLKDAGAQVRCVMWRSRAQLLGWRLENGQQVEARTLISFYEPRGEFQLTVEAIRRAGQGDLYERFLRLKAQLEAEGLFATENKRSLPTFPRRIAIVTSLQAAALRDVLSTLNRRAPHIAISLFPTPVQGEGAGPRIAAALSAAGGSDNDLILLCRGGGSIEDLWAFNEECVARAIRATRIPVIAGIGHETDFTIADFAADLRAPTPTAAAEMAAPERGALLAGLDALHNQLQRRLERALGERQQRLDWLAGRLLHPAEHLAQRRQQVEALTRRLHQAGTQRTNSNRLLLLAVGHRLAGARPRPARLAVRLLLQGRQLAGQMNWQLSRQQMKLNTLGNGLKQLDPHAVLKRGYALVTDAEGRAVRDASALRPGSTLHIDFARGSAQATVDQVVAIPEAE